MNELDQEMCFRAFAARDSRFDGVYFMGVTSTGIYCRTICRARKPRRENCRFFANASLAEQSGFRPCKLCRPEQSPGRTSNDFGSALVALAVRRIEQGALDDSESLEKLATQLGVSTRHMRRVFQDRMGVSPIQLAQTQRLLMAKRLLSETRLPILEVAMASGFGSLRRCNALFKSTYAMAPSEFRRESGCKKSVASDTNSITLTQGYRPPYNWQALLKYFQGRAIPGVEWIDDECYARTIRIADRCGWLRVTQDASRHALRVEIASELIGVIPVVLSRVRRAFDLDATPSAISDALSSDNCLAASFARSPGLRLPGAMDSFETAIRTIVGQQVSVSAATTVMGRIVQAFGQRFESPWPQLFLKPITPERIARESVDTLAPLGLNSARARAILSVARAIVDGELELEHSNDPERTVEQLQLLDGIGPWTAHYFGMRILGWPDAFIASDLVVRKQLAPLSVKQIEARSQVWRPWRAYAVMHLWHAAGFFHSNQSEKT